MDVAPTLRPARRDELATVIAIDDDATRLFQRAGLVVDLADNHPFVVEEHRRFAHALEQGTVLFAEDDRQEPIGVAVFDWADGAPHLEQLSVRVAAMRRGVGRRLLREVIEWADRQGGRLWLTTYDHLPWNRPFYQRAGFVVVPEERWGPGQAATIAAERAALPCPTQRVVMTRA